MGGSVAPLWRCRQPWGAAVGRYGDAITDEDENDDEELEPLELFPDPVAISAHDPDAGGPSVVRLFFRAGSHGGWPGGGISDVFVIEGSDHVSIGLVRRELQGDGPDGTGYGVSLKMGGWASLDVVLSPPLERARCSTRRQGSSSPVSSTCQTIGRPDRERARLSGGGPDNVRACAFHGRQHSRRRPARSSARCSYACQRRSAHGSAECRSAR
jgi:hypothetical protein